MAARVAAIRKRIVRTSVKASAVVKKQARLALGTVRSGTAGRASAWTILAGQIGRVGSDTASAKTTASRGISIEVVKAIAACAVAGRTIGR